MSDKGKRYNRTQVGTRLQKGGPDDRFGPLCESLESRALFSAGWVLFHAQQIFHDLTPSAGLTLNSGFYLGTSNDGPALNHERGDFYGPGRVEWADGSPDAMLNGVSISATYFTGEYTSATERTDSAGGSNPLEPLPFFAFKPMLADMSSMSGYNPWRNAPLTAPASFNRSDALNDADPSTGFALYVSTYNTATAWLRAGQGMNAPGGNPVNGSSMPGGVVLSTEGHVNPGLEHAWRVSDGSAPPGSSAYDSDPETAPGMDVTTGPNGATFTTPPSGGTTSASPDLLRASSTNTFYSVPPALLHSGSVSTGVGPGTTPATATEIVPHLVNIPSAPVAPAPVAPPQVVAITGSAVPAEARTPVAVPTAYYSLLAIAGNDAQSNVPGNNNVAAGMSLLAGVSGLSVWSRLSSLLGGGATVVAPPAGAPLFATLPGSLLGLAPSPDTSFDSDSRDWEITAGVCLGVALAGYWYSSATYVEQEAQTLQAGRLRRSRNGWQLVPCEER